MKSTLTLLAISALLCGSFTSVHSLPYSYNFENLTPGSVSPPPTGNVNQPNANDVGWYGSSFSSDNRVTVSDQFNSPWDVGGSQSAAIVRTVAGGAAPTLFNYFTDSLDRYNWPENVNVTGSLGSALTGSGYSLSFDFRTPNRNTQPRFFLYNGGEANNDVVLDVQMRFDGVLRVNGVDVPAFGTQFVNNTWYRVEITNLDVAGQSWDLEILEWSGSAENSIFSTTGLGFANSHTSIDRFRARSNSEVALSPIYFDNFSIIPEPATVALLFGAGALGIALIRRRRSVNR